MTRLVFILVLLFPTTTWAISNGSFEAGIAGWEGFGTHDITQSDFGITPTDGNNQLVLYSTLRLGSEIPRPPDPIPLPTLDSVLNLPAFTLPNTLGVIDGAVARQTFVASAGSTLSFDWNFMTDEVTPTSEIGNDAAFFTLKQPGAQYASLMLLANTFADFQGSGTFFNEETGYTTFTMPLVSSGEYTLAIGVGNVGDDIIDSGLAVDNVQVSGSGTNPVPEPSSVMLLGSGLAGLIGWRLKKRTE